MTCNGIIITKWQNDYKKGFQISGTHFFRNELIITKWRNDYKKGLRISDTHFFCNGIIITRKMAKQFEKGTVKFRQPFSLYMKNKNVFLPKPHNRYYPLNTYTT